MVRSNVFPNSGLNRFGFRCLITRQMANVLRIGLLVRIIRRRLVTGDFRVCNIRCQNRLVICQISILKKNVRQVFNVERKNLLAVDELIV